MTTNGTYPCHVQDPSGNTRTELTKEEHSTRWFCNNQACKVRSLHLKSGKNPNEPLGVEIRVREQAPVIVWCEGGGRAERK